MKARLIEWREIAPEVRHFLFEVPELDKLEFRPGQFVSFSGEVNGKRITRPYSLAGAPSGNRFELCLNRVKDGLFSPRLFELVPGDTVEMREPLGYFVPRKPFGEAVFVATGTGVAPFRSMLMAPEVIESGLPVTLLLGARYEEGLLYRQEFESLSQRLPLFRFLPTITRPEPHWTGLTGWVQQHLDSILGGRKDLDIYVCGLRAMVDAVRALAKERGFERTQVHSEKYD